LGLATQAVVYTISKWVCGDSMARLRYSPLWCNRKFFGLSH
jgi:hypothetical protein